MNQSDVDAAAERVVSGYQGVGGYPEDMWEWACDANTTAMAYLASPPRKLKGLEWKESRGMHYAFCGFWKWGVRELPTGCLWWVSDGSGRAAVDDVCTSIDHGKKLCEADYATRVDALYEKGDAI